MGNPEARPYSGWLLYADRTTPLIRERRETHQLVASAARHGVNLRVLDPGRFEFVAAAGIITLNYDSETLTLPDVVLPRMGTKTCARTLMLLEHLERSQVVLVNSSSAVNKTADKFKTMLHLGLAGLPIPRTLLPATASGASRTSAEHPPFPLLHKPVDGTHGEGIWLLENFQSAEKLRSGGTLDPSSAMLQEYVAASAGRAVRALVFGDEILVCYEKHARDSYKANTATGASIIPFPDCEKVRKLAHAVMDCLSMDFAGIDFVFDGERAVICDVNSAPSFVAAQEALGIDLGDRVGSLIADLLEHPTTTGGRYSHLPEPLWDERLISFPIEQEIRHGGKKPTPKIVPAFFTDLETASASRSVDHINWRPRSYQGEVNPSVRDCFYAELPLDEWAPLTRFARECLESAIGRAVNLSFAAAPLIYRYPPGRGMLIHHDMVTRVEVKRALKSGQPVNGGDYTVVWFLNSLAPDQGGELYFPETDGLVRAVAGTAVAFRVDIPHGVLPLAYGERRVVVARFFCVAEEPTRL